VSTLHYGEGGILQQQLSYLYAMVYCFEGGRTDRTRVVKSSCLKCWLQTQRFFRFSIATFSLYLQFFAAFIHCWWIKE